MKVLWICNVENQDAAEYNKRRGYDFGGWLTGLSDSLKKYKDLELIYCYPLLGKKEQEDFVFGGIHYYSFYTRKKYGFLPINADTNDELKRQHLQRIISIEQPDVIHIFGSEYCHAKMVCELVENKNRIVCSIQGLISICALHYLRLLPIHIIKKRNVASIFRKSLYGQMKEMERRGKNEIDFLKMCPNVVGRTEWDKVCTYDINSNRKYFSCNETLRKRFYQEEWSIERCQRKSIFMSQGSSPIKGINILIQALALMKKKYPDVLLKIAGNNFAADDTIVKKLKRSTYGEYIAKLIKIYDLESNVKFCGMLDENQMVKAYLDCNVFVSASIIENSSNSVGEAMLLGVPIVSSFVGGIPSLLSDEKEGLFYSVDEPYMLARCIERLFEDDDLAIELGKNARQKALETHNIDINSETMMDIYKEIISLDVDNISV